MKATSRPLAYLRDRLLDFLFLLLALAVGRLSLAAEVSLIGVVKGHEWVQTNATALIPQPDSAFWFSAIILTTNPDALVSASVRPPNGSVRMLEREDLAWELEQAFASRAALDAAFPDSPAVAYEVSYQSAGAGSSQTVSLFLGDGAFPAPSRLLNYDALQAMDAAKAITLEWTAMEDARPDDVILLTIERAADGLEVYSTGLPGEPHALPGVAHSLELPAGLLGDATRYEVTLSFLRLVDRKALDASGGLGLAAYVGETTSAIQTLGKPTSAGLRFAFTAQEGILPIASAGQVAPAYPEPPAIHLALHFTVDDPGSRPDGVVFHGPGGAVFESISSAGFWDFLGPTTRVYYSPSQGMPPRPPGGVYTVDYAQGSYSFDLAEPDTTAAEVRIRPSVNLTSGRFSEVAWVYLDSDGASIAAPAAFQSLTLRVESETGELFHGDNLPVEPRRKVLPASLSWSQVRRITFMARDATGNLFQSSSLKWDQPRILGGTLPDAEVGVSYSGALTPAGGQPPYVWQHAGGDPLPAGLQFSAQGVLSGTPETARRHYLDVRLRDSAGRESLATVVVAVLEAGTPDVVFYRLDLEKVFRQTSSDPAAPPGQPSCYRFLAQVYGTSAASVRTAELIPPSLLTYGLSRLFYQNPDLVYVRETEDPLVLSAWFPAEDDYRLRLQTARDGERDVHLAATGGPHPPPPFISNWADLQFAPISGALYVYWRPWTDGGDQDFIYAELQDPITGYRRSGSVWPPLPMAMDGRRVGVGFGLDTLFPPLEPGHFYRIKLAFVRPGTWRPPEANPDYPGVTGLFGTTTSTEITVVTAMDYDAWCARSFPEPQVLDPLITGMLQDPDGDGWSNLLEYAVGGYPLTADARPLLTVTGEGPHVLLTHPRQAGAAEAQVEIQTTSRLEDPASWRPVHEAISSERLSQVWEATEDAMRLRVRTRVEAATSAGTQFFRLRVQPVMP